MKKNIDEITESDINNFKVWKFISNDDIGELMISPIKKLPVKNLAGKIVFTAAELANGANIWVMLGNLDPEAPELTKHFMTVSFLKENHWFHLARYHDPDYLSRGSAALADFLELRIDEIFPVKYDASFAYKKTDKETILIGDIPESPVKKLTRAEVVALAVP